MTHRPHFASCCVLPLIAVGLTATATETSSWYVFEPSSTSEPGEIGMQDWIEKPAGKHGRITRERDKLLCNGESIKLWGVNLCYGTCAPDKELADKRAAFYPKYGINSVRLHKYVDGPGWAGIQSPDSCIEFDPEDLDRMDYQVAKFKEAGIYILLSAHFGALKLGPADKQYVPYLEEFGTFEGNKNRVTTPHSAVQYSPELQDVQIRQMVRLLEHKNPYTGLTYAQDPAVAFLEIINEQSILFYTSMNPLKASPTLRRQVAGRFSDWLRDKYGSHEKLAAAWGEKAFDGFEGDGFPAGEHLDKRNILPLGNPWYWDPEQLNGSQAYRRQRLLDTMQFLYELQCGFYDRYVQAMREAGYAGEILGSNWQAGRALSHFYNLHSDWRVGTIDRHNYFGGGRARPGEKFNNATMLRTAGSGTLSVGLQQASDRPFMLSEWIHVFPSEWGVEGPAILAAYGYGLQGWDVSYMFQNRDNGGFSDRIGRDQWDVTAPQVLGIFPAVARQVLRGDVKESDLLAPLYVYMPSWRGRPALASRGHPGLVSPDRGTLAASQMRGQDALATKLGFTDRTVQQYDVKSFDTDKVPARALAVARCAIEFTDQYRDTPAFDVTPHEKDGFLTSSTNQLRWKEGSGGKLGGYFTINTAGTKAVVGFAEGRECRLGEVTITPQSPFAAIYVTAAEPDKDIGTSKKLLITAIARARNAGMKFNEIEDELLDRGKPPILMEPVKATITIRKPGSPKLYPLNHDGLRTQTTLPIQDGTFTLDTARDKTPYYLIQF